MSEVGPGPVNDNCDTTGNEGLDPANWGSRGVKIGIQGSAGGGRERMCGGDDEPDPPSSSQYVTCGNWTSRVNALLLAIPPSSSGAGRRSAWYLVPQRTGREARVHSRRLSPTPGSHIRATRACRMLSMPPRSDGSHRS